MAIPSPVVPGLATDIVAALQQFCALHGVALAVIFGSRGRDDSAETSDLDILVHPASAATFDLLGFEAEAQRIVGRIHVDATLLHPGLSSALAWEALRDAVVLWEETAGMYDRTAALWHERFLQDEHLRRSQVVYLSERYLCR